MKHNLLFSLILFLIFTHATHAMETTLAIESKKNNYLEVAMAIKHPYERMYITNNSVFIGGDEGCSIINLLTKEEKILSYDECQFVAMHKDKKRIAFGGNKTVQIYNLETDQQEWRNKEQFSIDSCWFNPQKDNLIMFLAKDSSCEYSIVTKRSYKKDVGDEYYNIENSNQAVTVLCPKKQIICVAEGNGTILFYPLADSKAEPKKMSLFHNIAVCQAGLGAFIAVTNQNRKHVSLIKIDDAGGGKCDHSLVRQKNEVFIRALFYPLGDVLAVTSKLFALPDSEDKTDTYFMNYWDINAKRLICRMQMEQDDNGFAFSPDGTNVIISFVDKFVQICRIYPVPFEAIHESNIEKTFLHYWFLLKEFINNQKLNNEDIKLPFKHALLTTFRREKR